MKKKIAVILAIIALTVSIFPMQILANNGDWDYDSANGKYYYVENGEDQHGWILHNGYWYYCNPYRIENGTCVVGGKTYYFDADGRMVTGWKYLPAKSGKNNWYYFNPDGSMLTNSVTPDGSMVGADGKWI